MFSRSNCEVHRSFGRTYRFVSSQLKSKQRKVLYALLHAGYLLALLVSHEIGDGMHLQNVGVLLPEYAALHPGIAQLV
jgi:hypothetical protein